MEFTYKNILFYILIILAIAAAFAVLLRLFPKVKERTLLPSEKFMPSATIAGVKVNLEMAITPAEKAQGLSNRKSLPEDTGMLFVFDNKATPGFWMIDMHFPIDIIWILNDKVIGIAKNAQPELGKRPMDLKRYYPPEAINYVLEVNAGFTDKNGIEVGDSVIFNL